MSQSAARRPPQPFHVLLTASPGDSVAPQPPPPALPVSPSIRGFRGPHVPLRRALTCRPAGEKSHYCSEVALRSAGLQPASSASPPPATEPCPHCTHWLPLGLDQAPCPASSQPCLSPGLSASLPDGVKSVDWSWTGHKGIRGDGSGLHRSPSPLPAARVPEDPHPSQAPHAHSTPAICAFGAGTLPGSGWSCHRRGGKKI